MSDKDQSDFYSNVIVLDFDEDLGDLDKLKQTVRDDAFVAADALEKLLTDEDGSETDAALEAQTNEPDAKTGERLYRGDIVDFFARYCDSKETSLHFRALMHRARKEKAKIFLWKPPGNKVEKPELLDLMEAFGAVVMVLPGD
jgi:hypothetical protein